MSKLTKDDVLSFIREKEDKDLSASVVRKADPSAYYAGQKLFGSWGKAIEAAGRNYSSIRVDNKSKSKWTKEDVIQQLTKLPEDDLIDKNLRKKHGGLYTACLRLFGSRKNAITAAGIDYENTLIHIPWTKSRVINAIQVFYLNNVPLNYKFINTYHTRLRKRAEKFFDSWGNAVEAAGLNYEEIKKNKGWGKPFIGEDGTLYESQTKGLVSNELYSLKQDGKILDYLPNQDISPGRNLSCDFVAVLTNGAKFWLEVDGPGDHRSDLEQLHERIEFYEKANYLYQKVASHRNLAIIIERLTNWFTIPLEDSLITTHKNPDGDALSSARAVYDHLLEHGKHAAIRLHGEIPKNLEWIIDGTEVIKKVPDWTQNVIVLDCAPAKDRIGWDIPENLPIYNIDHHMSRITDNDPDSNIHVIKSCSTAALLYSRFGIKNDILAVGVYTDTFFTKHISEVFYFIDDFNIDEEKLNSFISRVNVNTDRKVWDILTTAKIRKCRNGFVIVETEDFGSPDVLESVMQILSKLNESVCFIYGKHKMVKLRTSNAKLDLSQIAKSYSGGGHPYASMCQVNGKVSEFKNKIIALDVQSTDGYGSDA